VLPGNRTIQQALTLPKDRAKEGEEFGKGEECNELSRVSIPPHLASPFPLFPLDHVPAAPAESAEFAQVLSRKLCERTRARSRKRAISDSPRAKSPRSRRVSIKKEEGRAGDEISPRGRKPRGGDRQFKEREKERTNE